MKRGRGCVARPQLWYVLAHSFARKTPLLLRQHRSQPMLEKLCGRARHTYSTFCSNTSGGSQTTLPLTLPASSPPKGGDTPSPKSSLSAVSGECPASLAQPPAGSIPGSIQQQSPFGIPYSTPQDVTRIQRTPEFRPSLFVPQERTMLPSFESGYSVSSERTQFPPPSQGSAQQQNPSVILPTEETLDVDLEALGLHPIPQQPMQYSLYPQLEQFRDIFMGENTGAQPPQTPQDDVWWKFVDDLGIQRI